MIERGTDLRSWCCNLQEKPAQNKICHLTQKLPAFKESYQRQMLVWMICWYMFGGYLTEGSCQPGCLSYQAWWRPGNGCPSRLWRPIQGHWSFWIGRTHGPLAIHGALLARTHLISVLRWQLCSGHYLRPLYCVDLGVSVISLEVTEEPNSDAPQQRWTLSQKCLEIFVM